MADDPFLIEAIDRNLGTVGVGKTIVKGLDVSRRSYARGEYVHREGDEIVSLYIVADGWVTLIRDLITGDRQLLNFFVPVDIVNIEYLGRATATSDLVAFQSSELYVIPITQFKKALMASGTAVAATISLLGRKYGSLQNRLCVFANDDARGRIVHLINGIRLKQIRNGSETPDILNIPLTQQDMADALGITNITVSRIFADLEAEGSLLYTRNRIEILNYNQLIRHNHQLSTNDDMIDEFD